MKTAQLYLDELRLKEEIRPAENLSPRCAALVSMLMLTSDKNTATSFHCFKRTAAFNAP